MPAAWNSSYVSFAVLQRKLNLVFLGFSESTVQMTFIDTKTVLLAMLLNVSMNSIVLKIYKSNLHIHNFDTEC